MQLSPVQNQLGLSPAYESNQFHIASDVQELIFFLRANSPKSLSGSIRLLQVWTR